MEQNEAHSGIKPNLECKIGGVLNQLKALNGGDECLLSVWNEKGSVLVG